MRPPRRSAAWRLPGRRGPGLRPDRASRGRRQRRRLSDRPSVGKHAGKARHRHRRFDGHDLVPGLHCPARGGAGHERPDVRRCGHPGDPLRGAFPGDEVPDYDPIGHLAVVGNADAYLIAPASANTLAKLGTGIADSMVTTSFLACTAPRAVAPAMNDRMYADAATQANLATLRERGIRVIDPEEGELASRGEYGMGRLPSPERLLADVAALAGAPRG